MKRNAAIIASGMSVPDRIVPNSYFNEILGEDVDTWLRTNVQIYERRWTTGDESVADLAERACRQALERAETAPESIDLIIVATDTPEYISPATAAVVQERLGLVNAGAFDLNNACAGFVTGLDVGCKFIQSDENYHHVLVVGAYNMSKFLNLHDKKTVTLFADGAGAVLLKVTHDGSGLLQSMIRGRAEYSSWMGIYAGAAKHPITHEAIDNNEHKLRFVRKIPIEVNPEMWPNMILELCKREGIDVQECHHFFFTQININTIHMTMDTLGVDRARAATIMHYYGYTGSAAIPIAFDAWNTQGKIRKGDLAVFMGSGGGLAFSAALFRI